MLARRIIPQLLVDGKKLIKGRRFDGWRSVGVVMPAVKVHQQRQVDEIMILDIVFSIDSVITAIGLAKQLSVMVAAIVIAVIVMIFLAGRISSFVDNHPTIKMLALSFLLLIGISLIGEGLGLHIPKGYIYFAMAFSIGVELLNMRARKKRESGMIHLTKKISEGDGA